MFINDSESEGQRGSLSPSLKLPTGQFFNARSGSRPDGTTKTERE